MTALWNEAEWKALIAMLGEDDADMVCGLLAEFARLQARLAACPTVEQLRGWVFRADPTASEILETAERMEAENVSPVL